jgi:catechol 2,3-dioxygenase-like lactoylglutathione lyase family enzyme
MTLGSAELVAFAATIDLARAREFYEGVLGLPLEHEDGFACVFRVGATQLRVTRVKKVATACSRTPSAPGAHPAEPEWRGSATRTATCCR